MDYELTLFDRIEVIKSANSKYDLEHNAYLSFRNGYIRFMRRYGSFVLIGIVVIGFFFERIGIPEANIFGLYLSKVQEGIILLFNDIMGGLLG